MFQLSLVLQTLSLAICGAEPGVVTGESSPCPRAARGRGNLSPAREGGKEQPSHHITRAHLCPHSEAQMCTSVEGMGTARGWQLCQPTLSAWSIRALSVRAMWALLPPLTVCSHSHCCSLAGAGSSAEALSGHCDLQREMLSNPPLPLPCRNRHRDQWGCSQGGLLALAFLSS